MPTILETRQTFSRATFPDLRAPLAATHAATPTKKIFARTHFHRVWRSLRQRATKLIATMCQAGGNATDLVESRQWLHGGPTCHGSAAHDEGQPVDRNDWDSTPIDKRKLGATDLKTPSRQTSAVGLRRL